MKKLLVFLVMISFMISFVAAISTTTFLGTKESGTAVLSNEQSVSATQSAKLYAPFDGSTGPEGRVRIEFSDPTTLEDIINISWMQYVTQGYIAHVDILIDTTGDDNVDDALVFEWDKVTDVGPTPLVSVMTYTRNGWINTLDDRGVIIDDSTYGWLASEDAGPVGGVDYTAYTLADWKLGQESNKYDKEIPANVAVIAIEIEVDGWVAESEAFIDDVEVNGELVEDFEGTQTGEGEIIPDMTFLANPNPLNFGAIVPGRSSTKISTLSVGASHLQVTEVSVTPDIGSVFNETNVMFSLDGTTFEFAVDIDPINIAAETSEDLYVKLSIPVGTSSGSFSGVITYTVMEQP